MPEIVVVYAAPTVVVPPKFTVRARVEAAVGFIVKLPFIVAAPSKV